MPTRIFLLRIWPPSSLAKLISPRLFYTRANQESRKMPHNIHIHDNFAKWSRPIFIGSSSAVSPVPFQDESLRLNEVPVLLFRKSGTDRAYDSPSTKLIENGGRIPKFPSVTKESLCLLKSIQSGQHRLFFCHHLMTLSALYSIDCGIVTAICFAVF